MKGTHTPGPWHVGEIRPEDDYDERMVDTGPGGAVICSVWPMGEDFNVEETPNAPTREANARLIAAAPDMRELLARLHAAMQTGVITEGMEADTRALLARIDGDDTTGTAPCSTCHGTGVKMDANGIYEDDVCPACDGGGR